MQTKQLNEKKFLLKKDTQKWLNENITFYKDICNLINEMMMFEIKYGIKILYSFKYDIQKKDK